MNTLMESKVRKALKVGAALGALGAAGGGAYLADEKFNAGKGWKAVSDLVKKKQEAVADGGDTPAKPSKPPKWHADREVGVPGPRRTDTEALSRPQTNTVEKGESAHRSAIGKALDRARQIGSMNERSLNTIKNLRAGGAGGS